MFGGNTRFEKMRSVLDNNQVVVLGEQAVENGSPGSSLDLGKIATPELRLLSPRSDEISRGVERQKALLSYSDRLRNSYKYNEDGLRDGMKLLAETVERGQSITVSCSCRSGEMCHADVVKMAVEKVRARLNERQQQVELAQNRDRAGQEIIPGENPRTARAIAEILSVSDLDRKLARIDSTEGRSRADHAAYLSASSQFLRDTYERGATVRDGVLIIPSDGSSQDPLPLAIATHEYAVKRLEQILKSETKAKELAPTIVDFGNKIAGSSPDRESKLKVFTWMYEALDGKNEFLQGSRDEITQNENKSDRFQRNLDDIGRLAEELSQLEPADKFLPLDYRDHEQAARTSPDFGEELSTAELYEESLNREQPDAIESEHELVTGTDSFERIDLESVKIPQLPSHLTEAEMERWLKVKLPAIDRDIESGKRVQEILKPFEDIVYQTAIHDPANKRDAGRDLKFAAAYIDHQLKQPESRMRNENERYRNYALRLEKATSRTEIINVSSGIRNENAALGLGWNNLTPLEKENTPKPLTFKEMQFLFTEISPSHYTADMTAARLTYSHAGASRRTTAEALLKGEIKPSPEAARLIESLESRLERRQIRDSISATKHFFESIKTPNEELRYKNSFDHKEIYSKLPPPEKDFVYHRAVHQKEQLEAKLAHRVPEQTKAGQAEHATIQPEPNRAEKVATSRNGVKSDLIDLLRKQPGMKGSDLIDQTNIILTRHFDKIYSLTLTKENSLKTALSREIGEKIENGLQFTERDNKRAGLNRVNPNNSSNNNQLDERTTELHQPYKDHLPESRYVR